MRKKGRGAKGECAPGGAEGMRVGSGGQRTPFPVLGHRGPNQLRCPAAGRISTPPHRAGGNRTTGGQCLPHVSRQEGGGGHGAGAPLRGAKYLGRPAWRPLSPGSPGAAAGRGWPAWGRKWVQEGQEQDPEARPPPTMRRPPATIPGQGQGQGSAGEGGPHTSRFMLRVGFRGKAPSAGGAKPSTVPPAISYQ